MTSIELVDEDVVSSLIGMEEEDVVASSLLLGMASLLALVDKVLLETAEVLLS